MNLVTVSPKFQVVIPKEVREHLKVKPKQKFVVMEGPSGVIHLVPDLPVTSLRGLMKGMDYSGYREEEEDPYEKPDRPR